MNKQIHQYASEAGKRSLKTLSNDERRERASNAAKLRWARIREEKEKNVLATPNEMILQGKVQKVSHELDVWKKKYMTLATWVTSKHGMGAVDSIIATAESFDEPDDIYVDD